MKEQRTPGLTIAGVLVLSAAVGLVAWLMADLWPALIAAWSGDNDDLVRVLQVVRDSRVEIGFVAGSVTGWCVRTGTGLACGHPGRQGRSTVHQVGSTRGLASRAAGHIRDRPAQCRHGGRATHHRRVEQTRTAYGAGADELRATRPQSQTTPRRDHVRISLQ